MARGTQQAKQQKKGANQAGRQSGLQGQQASTQATESKDAIEMLKQDHRKVEQLFKQFEQSSDDEQKEGLVDRICAELIVHTRLEEELFYPACREAGVDEDKLDESQVEHDGAKMLINDLLEAHGDDDYFAAKVSVLKEMIRHHVEEEEDPNDGVFAQAREHRLDEANLGQRMARRKQELQQRGIGRRPARPVAIGMRGGRDIYGYEGDGRFRGDNERGYGARQRYDEDEYDGGYERSGRRSAGYEGDWNEARYEGRYEPPHEASYEDRRYGRGPGSQEGGWFGDPRGHSEASRRGWEERRTDDDRRRYGHSRRDEDERRGRSEHGGWYGDSRAHAEASRRGWAHRR